MSRSRAWSIPIAAISLVALVVAACGSPSPAPSEAPTASQSAAPSVAPSPSPVADVSGPFEAAFAAIKTGRITVDGTITVGDVQAEVSGVTTFAGPDSEDSTTTTLGGVATTTQHVKVAGKRYAQSGAGPWLVDTSPEPTVKLDDQLAQNARAVTDAGLGTPSGSPLPLHKLVPSVPTFDPAALGLGAGNPTNVRPTVTFYAQDDGTPDVVTLDLTWTQPAGTSTVDGSLSLEFRYSELAIAHTIPIPDHVWTAFKSARFGFRLAYPDDFDYTKVTDGEYFTGPDNQVIAAQRTALSGVSLNTFTSMIVSVIKKQFRTTTVENDSATLAGAKARLLTFTGTDPTTKQKVVLYYLLCQNGKYFYDLFWESPVGNQASDLTKFKQAVGTFSFS